MIVPILYGNETREDLIRIRKTCGIRIIGLSAYKYLSGVDNTKHMEIQKEIGNLMHLIYDVCRKLTDGDEEKALHQFVLYMKKLDKKLDTIDNIVYGKEI